MTKHIKNVIVAGATGNLGSQIVKELLEQGADVAAMVMASSNRNAFAKMGVKNFVVGDMMDAASLGQALSRDHGFDVIVAGQRDIHVGKREIMQRQIPVAGRYQDRGIAPGTQREVQGCGPKPPSFFKLKRPRRNLLDLNK